MTLATTVPTFFIRLKPTSSMAKPACMNITRRAATTTQMVSLAMPAAEVALLSSAARAAKGVRADTVAMTPARIQLAFHVGHSREARSEFPHAYPTKEMGVLLVSSHGRHRDGLESPGVDCTNSRGLDLC